MPLEQLKTKLPQRLRRVLANVKANLGALLVDSGNWLLNQDASIPPARLHFVGHGSFGAVGFEFLRYFIELGGIVG